MVRDEPAVANPGYSRPEVDGPAWQGPCFSSGNQHPPRSQYHWHTESCVIGLTKRRRRKLRQAPFPAAWRTILVERMPYYRSLPETDKQELEGHVQVLIREKYFEGCAGQIITDEVKVLIAAQASLLLLHRDSDYFPWMRTILVYPNSFVGNGKSVGPAGVVTEGPSWRQGESWYTPGSGGPVVLSWTDVVAGAADQCDGRNLVLHEFAHQLDADSGAVEGVPGLATAAEVERWKRVLAREQQLLARESWQGLPTLLNPYGLQNPAEFFAVSVESFFERATEMKSRHPELYALLADYFRQDPASRSCGVREAVA